MLNQNTTSSRPRKDKDRHGTRGEPDCAWKFESELYTLKSLLVTLVCR